MKKIFIILVFGFLIVSCKKEEPVIPSSSGPFSPVFPGSTYVTVPNYVYFVDSGNLYYVQYIMHGLGVWDSTTNQYIDTVDKAPRNPSFVWNPTKQKYVMVAVFSEKIQIDMDNYEIANPESMVWVWNTGMKTGDEGIVKFNDGCDVVNGVIQYEQQPHLLNYGSTYYWAMWAWDADALNIIYSSRQIRFHVE